MLGAVVKQHPVNEICYLNRDIPWGVDLLIKSSLVSNAHKENEKR